MMRHTTTGGARQALRGLLAAAALGLWAPSGRAEQAAPPQAVWTENLNGALSRASSELKPVLLVFSAPNCPWCVRLKEETLAEPEVRAALEGFICVGIDTSRDERPARLYQVRGVPATLILSGDGRPQASAEGFLNKADFLAFLDAYRRGGGKRDASSLSLEAWLKALRERTVTEAQWPEIMAALGDKNCRAPLHGALLACEPCPRRAWAGLLTHARLAVRLGALELLEEVAGGDFGYDPWSDATENRRALEQWRVWSESATNAAQQVFAPLTEEQLRAYIRDLASGDRERSARAVRMLEQAGESAIPALDAWSATAQSAGEDARRRVREVRGFLLLPESLGAERTRIAHRLVFGNQDERVRSLEAAALAGERALPVLVEFLSDPDPLIRESAVDSVIAASREQAFPHLRDLLAREKDEEVIHAVVRGAGRLPGTNAVALAGPYLTHENEDLAVAALESLGRAKTAAAATAAKAGLTSPRWRVRAAALEAIGKSRAKSAGVEGEVIARLEDADPFVRRAAVQTLASLSAKKAAGRLKELFLKDDALKGPIAAALRGMDMALPESFAAALKGKDAEVLLAVLEGLDDGDNDTWRLALPFVGHANSDVACAAIRVVAEGGGQVSEGQAALEGVLRGGDKERALAVFAAYPADSGRSYSFSDDGEQEDAFEELVRPAEAGGVASDGILGDIFAAFGASAAPAAAPKAEAKPPALQDVFDAFGTEAVPSASAEAKSDRAPEQSGILKAAVAYLAPGRDPELRFAAALSVMAMGDEAGVAVASEALAARTAEERLHVAARVGRCKGAPVVALAGKLLRDPASEVRQKAVELCLCAASGTMITNLLAAAFEPGAALAPVDVFNDASDWHRAVRRSSLRLKIGAEARRMLQGSDESTGGEARRVLAVTLLETCWKAGDEELLKRDLESRSPFVRRAAWHALGTRKPEAFLAKAATVCRDPSEWVRGVVPAVYSRSGEVGWSVYFDAATAAEGMRSFMSSSGSRKRLAKPAAEALTSLTRDPALPVRVAALMVLLANREKVEVRLLVDALDALPDKREAASRLSSLLQDVQPSWLSELGNSDVLRLLDRVIALEDDDESRLRGLRQRLGAGVAGAAAAKKIVARSAAMPSAGEGAVPRAQGNAELAAAPKGASAPAQRLVVFFRNPGCGDCKRVEELLAALRAEFADLTVDVRSVRNPDDARLNEALCARFEVPDALRLTAPAVFCGAGALIKREITFERLGLLLGRAEATETEWRRVTETETESADRALSRRYASMSVWLVLGAGLLDGVNPCAFATIIFLLSYLQMTRRGPREILAVGAAFVAGLFLAYFLLGLGLVEVVVRLALLRRFGELLNACMAAFVAVVALVNVWDGVQCLRGRMGDMVLQLPKPLKARIHDVVSHSSRHRHFVAAAFVAGAVIAVLELACTGQVYAPTVLYMLKTGQGRAVPVAYLALYNAAFVVPLLVVFAGAYGGLRSESLIAWLRRHAATVKFATALLFAGLFVLFAFGGLG